ncbi:hypothetical protein Cgig2_007676 [Carnegiea gigantea]|uniref:DNA/RNA-binding protein Kin17 WH-like domain-containing protein n=1 Tax=Carnegiea gigantea TaxID=171969 RepID=A0A9Q1QBF3_9CARY|nr:hypothetical protein Cgig2_007676 [Carnegiea gigantea]
MNSTMWLTLAEFVKYLGTTGNCKVEVTPKGIGRRISRTKVEMVEEEKKERKILRQIERVAQMMPISENGGKLVFVRGGLIVVRRKEKDRMLCLRMLMRLRKLGKRQKVMLLLLLLVVVLMKEEEKVMQWPKRKYSWLCQGIIVKVMSKALAEKEGVVKTVLDKFVGQFEMLDTEHLLRVDQAELETIILQIGGLVRTVNEPY